MVLTPLPDNSILSLTYGGGRCNASPHQHHELAKHGSSSLPHSHCSLKALSDSILTLSVIKVSCDHNCRHRRCRCCYTIITTTTTTTTTTTIIVAIGTAINLQYGMSYLPHCPQSSLGRYYVLRCGVWRARVIQFQLALASS